MPALASTIGRVVSTYRTLRFRLTVWNTIVVTLISLLILIGLRQTFRAALFNEIDQILREDIQEVVLTIRATADQEMEVLTSELSRKALGHQEHGWFVELLDADRQSIWGSQSSGEADNPESLTPSNETASSPTDARLVEEPLTPAVRGVHFIRVGSEFGSLERHLALTDRYLYIAAGVLLLITPVCSYWLARRAAQTVADLIYTASRLRPSHLNERLPIHGTGDELDQLASTMNRLLDRIGIYLEQKRDFLANAAHELRTPLAAIRSSIEVALNSPKTSDEYVGILAELIDQSTTLETLVNQLLIISETETDQWQRHYEEVPLFRVVHSAVEMFQGVAETRNIELTSQVEEVNIIGSRYHLRQVVNNLLDNAIKYTPDGGEVRVSLQQDAESDTVTLSVQDNGNGISASDVPRIFERFFRADRSRSQPERGTGLGLSICEAVITAHGGKIHCESELQVGTLMRVTLPMKSVSYQFPANPD